MSFLTILLVILAVVVGVALIVAVVALFSPVVLEVDSARAQMRVRWLLAMEYRRPLPGTKGEARFSFAGKRIKTRPRKPKAKRKKVLSPREAEVRARRRAARGRFFGRCLRDSAIRRKLLRQLARLRRGVFRSVQMTRRRVRISLPDPATTGMLYGFTQFARGRLAAFQPNFTGENSVLLEIRLRPYRILRAVFSFLTGLPYRAMFREWRASSAGAPAQ
jgi:hypothetical protein